MAKRAENWTWSLLATGSGLGAVLLSAGCGGICGACFGCAGPGLLLATAAILRKKKKGVEDDAESGSLSSEN
ncbi:hypothetical protein MJO47_14695 [Desulfuromonas sp. KJ2020]|uniref:hypothetical protein n=1 Tax=Desulfuromonas sp. KJ2020 TaxID=2919173 RepID=UPI0020A7CF4A|nr:hypothetical protein [Desulfuromonas sp. KJ2020]MCP3178351.1 hypothetical protein [Desulfuromonas sp. KJ2020]